MKRYMLGFTLIELLITVAIIAIIATVAIPSYQAQVEKSRRTEAKAALSNIQLAQERFFTVNGSYALGTSASPLNALDLASGLTVAGDNLITTEQGFYNISLDAGATATAFTVNATGVGAQVGDDTCKYMKIDHLGVKTALESDGSTNSTNKCW